MKATLRTQEVSNSPLTALRDGADGGNGVYRYGTGGGFPASTYQSTNYWVDLVFSPSAPDTTKPTVTDRQPVPGATGIPVSTAISATFSEAVQESTIVMTLKAGSTSIPASKSYAPATRTVTLTPTSNLATVDQLHGGPSGREGQREQPNGSSHLVVHHGSVG